MEYLERRRALVEDRLATVLEDTEPAEMTDRVEHVSLSGGKRVRPLVTLLTFEAAGGTLPETATDPGSPERAAIDYAVGIELVHNASLVVDDIIDESPLRRGIDSAWAAFGHGSALVASDGLLGEAFALFSPDDDAMQVVSEAMVELGEGEATELVGQPSTETAYMELARRKTGSLFRAAAELGALAADADGYAVEAFGQYGEQVGVAFQIRDDVLDVTADADDLGKPTGQDAAMERPSLVQITELTPTEANARAHREAEAALDALETADTIDSTADGYLRDLAEFVVVRER